MALAEKLTHENAEASISQGVIVSIFQVNTMHSALKNIASELDKGGIQYSMVNECIHVELPKHFDTLIIEIWNAQ